MSTEQTVGPYRLRPVIIFVHGGMWRQGEKRIYTPVAQMGQSMGCVAVVVNYDLYPKGKIDTMVADIHAAIIWTHDHIRQFGGDPARIFILAHESGAHVVTLTLLHDAVLRRRRESEREAQYLQGFNGYGNGQLAGGPGGAGGGMGGGLLTGMGRVRGLREPGVELPQIEGVVLVAGIFDLPAHFEHERNRGFEEVSCLSRINALCDRSYHIGGGSITAPATLSSFPLRLEISPRHYVEGV
ncbi:hypothetical protein HDU93_002321 [Gonapodya sp. JEL0774]|nr:hypothetical protein HDU93_002321 [Gonapodya sp. JEL0774]